LIAAFLGHGDSQLVSYSHTLGSTASDMLRMSMFLSSDPSLYLHWSNIIPDPSVLERIRAQLPPYIRMASLDVELLGRDMAREQQSDPVTAAQFSVSSDRYTTSSLSTPRADPSSNTPAPPQPTPAPPTAEMQTLLAALMAQLQQGPAPGPAPTQTGQTIHINAGANVTFYAPGGGYRLPLDAIEPRRYPEVGDPDYAAATNVATATTAPP
jgi:hypothetical protein